MLASANGVALDINGIPLFIFHPQSHLKQLIWNFQLAISSLFRLTICSQWMMEKQMFGII
jgi:hypothetical protein